MADIIVKAHKTQWMTSKQPKNAFVASTTYKNHFTIKKKACMRKELKSSDLLIFLSVS